MPERLNNYFSTNYKQIKKNNYAAILHVRFATLFQQRFELVRNRSARKYENSIPSGTRIELLSKGFSRTLLLLEIF